jgi:hypothetical protein
MEKFKPLHSIPQLKFPSDFGCSLESSSIKGNRSRIIMKFKISLAICVFLCSTGLIADEVSDLRDMARISGDYRELTIDCLIEVKINRANGWKSEECLKYKHFSENELQAFKSNIKTSTSAFTAYSKSGSASKNRIKRGLKQLIIIQENMESIGGLSAKIKSKSKT